MLSDDEELLRNDIIYCSKQWEIFTTLTEKEQNNLREIEMFLGKKWNKNFKSSSKAVYCKELKMSFESITKCARHFGVSAETIKHYAITHQLFKSKYHLKFMEEEC